MKISLALHANLSLVGQLGRTLLRDITVERIRRGVFHSVDDLKAAIQGYFDQHNANPKPYQWTAKPVFGTTRAKAVWINAGQPPYCPAFIQTLGPRAHDDHRFNSRDSFIETMPKKSRYCLRDFFGL